MARPIQKRTKKPVKFAYSLVGSKYDTRDSYTMVGKMRRRFCWRSSLRTAEVVLTEGGASSGGAGVLRPLGGVSYGNGAIGIDGDFLPCEPRGVERSGVLSKSSRNGGVHGLPGSRLVDVGMLQVREVAVCRAVRHDGDVTPNRQSRALQYMPCRLFA